MDLDSGMTPPQAPPVLADAIEPPALPADFAPTLSTPTTAEPMDTTDPIAPSIAIEGDNTPPIADVQPAPQATLPIPSHLAAVVSEREIFHARGMSVMIPQKYEASPLPAFSNNYFAQMEALLRVKHQIMNNSERKLDPQISFKLRALQRFVVQEATDHLAASCQRLLMISNAFPKNEAPSLAAKPTTRDRKETVDDYYSEGVLFYCLETLYDILKTATPAKMALVPPEVLAWCYKSVAFYYPTATRHEASLILALFSESPEQAKWICEKLVNDMKQINKDDISRAFVPYMKMVSYLRFTFEPMSVGIFMEFLRELLRAVDKVERGVLREEICSSVIAILQYAVGHNAAPNDNEATIRRMNFMTFQTAPEAPLFWELLIGLFHIVTRWSRKPKHYLFSAEFLVALVHLGNRDIFRHGEEVVKLLVSNYKDKALHVKCLDLTHDYIAGVSMEIANLEQGCFNTQLRIVIPPLLPKKTIVPPNESELVASVIIEAGRKHIHFAINIIMEVCKGDSYTVSQKAVAYRALSAMCQEFPQDVQGYQFGIAPLVCPILATSDDEMLLRSTVRIFPVIQDPDPSKKVLLVKRLASLSLSSDREISIAAVQSLQDYVLVAPQINMVDVIKMMTSLLSKELDTETTLKAFQAIRLILNAFREDLEQASDRTIAVDAPVWLLARRELEGCCLLWLAHTEQFIRNEALTLLREFSQPIFRRVEKEALHAHVAVYGSDPLSQPPYLADVFAIPGGDGADLSLSASAWLKPLTHVLINGRQEYSQAIDWAWIRVETHWNASCKANLDQAENFGLFKNQLRFLCLAAVESRGSDPDAVSATDMNRFLSNALGLIAGSSEAVRNETARIIGNYLQFGCVNQLFKIITGDGYDKNQDPRITLQYLDVFSLIACRMEPVFYNSNDIIGVTFMDLMAHWFSLKSTASLSPRVCILIAKILQKFMELYDNLPPSENVEKFNQKFFRFLLMLLPQITMDERGVPSRMITPATPNEKAIETNVLSTMKTWLARAALNDSQLESDVLNELCQMDIRGEHVIDPVASTLDSLLHMNHRMIRIFLDSAWTTDGGKYSGSTFVPVSCLRAITANFDTSLIRSEDEEDKVPLGTFVLLALLQMCTPEASTRKLGIELAHSLAPLTVTVSQPPASQQFAIGYMSETRAFAYAIAAKRPELLVQIMDAAVDILPNLSDSMIGVFMQVVLPWFKRVDHVIDRSHCQDALGQVFSKLWQATPLLSSKDAFMPYIEAIWTGFATNTTVISIVSFLITRVTEEGPDCWPFVAIAIRCLGRSACLRSVIGHLARLIRSYDPPSDDAHEYLRQAYTRNEHTPDNTASEGIAFQLLSELAREHSSELIAYLPLILQNAMIQISTGAPVGSKMLAHLLLCLCNRVNDDKARDEALDFVSEFLNDPVTGAIPRQPAQSFPPPWTMALVKLMSRYRPGIDKEWSDVGLAWALQPYDPQISRNSLFIISAITGDQILDVKIIPRVMQIVAVALKNADHVTCETVLNVFLLPMADKDSVVAQVGLDFIRAAVSLLHFPWISVYELALKLLGKVLSNTEAVAHTILSLMPAQGRGEALVKLFLPGLQESQTCNATLDIMKRVTELIVPILGDEGMPLAVICVLLMDVGRQGGTVALIDAVIPVLHDVINMNVDDEDAFLHALAVEIHRILHGDDAFFNTAVVSLLNHGVAAWKLSLLKVQREMLLVADDGVDTDCITVTSEVAYRLSCTTDTRISEAAVNLMVVLDQTARSDQKRGQVAGLYDFLEEEGPVPPTPETGVFKSMIADAFDEAVHVGLEKILRFGCGVDDPRDLLSK